MGEYDDDVRLRARDDDLGGRMSQVDKHALAGSPCAIFKTTKKTTYPTEPDRFYYCERLNIDGVETEGGLAVQTATGSFTYAYNLGDIVPPEGTSVVANFVDHRWVFDWSQTCEMVYEVTGCGGAKMGGVTIKLSQGGVVKYEGITSGRLTAINTVIMGAYTTVPNVTFFGGGGGGAAAKAQMQLNTLTRTSGGSGYTNGSYTNGLFSGGGGSGGTFNYTVTGGVIQPTLTITNRGQNYTTPPTPVFNCGPGTGAAATVNLGVKATIITNAGAGYTSVPTVQYAPGGAQGNATITAGLRFPKVKPGTYDYVYSKPRYKTISGTAAFTCSEGIVGGGTINMVPDPSWHCPNCPCPEPLPNKYYLTDGAGDHVLTGPSGDPVSGGGWGVYADFWSCDAWIMGEPSVGDFCTTTVLPDSPYRIFLRQECSGFAPPTGWRLVYVTWSPYCPSMCACPGVTYKHGNKIGTRHQDFTSTNTIAPVAGCMPQEMTFNMPTTQSGEECPGGGGSITVRLTPP